jgi:hypothetical protein
MANTALSVLQTNALTMADHPTADVTAQNTMKLFINQTLQELYQMSGQRLLQDRGTITTVANQEYVLISGITILVNATFPLDEIVNIYQLSDDIKLIRLDIKEYRRIFADVTSQGGNPTHYARFTDRLYLYPRPSSAIVLYIDCYTLAPNLSAAGDVSLISPKFDEVILSGTVYRWHKYIEPDDSNKILIHKKIYDELKMKFEIELNREEDRIPVARSHINDDYREYATAKSPWGI